MKIYLIAILLSVLSTSLFAKEKATKPKYKEKIGNFKIWKNENYQYYIEKLDKEPILMKIQSAGGYAGLKEIKKLKTNKDILLIIYFGGSSGSKVEVNHFRAAIWSKTKNQFLGDILYRNVSAKNSILLDKSSLSIKSGKLIVKRKGLIREEFNLK